MTTRLSAFNYFGGKNNPQLLQWILSNLAKTPCTHFVDLFGGSGAVLLNYNNCQLKTFNDLNGDIVNFFQQLRENGDALIRALELSPYSRSEYERFRKLKHPNKLEWARRFMVRSLQSFGNSGSLKVYNSWSYTIRDSRYGVSQSVARWLSKIEGLREVTNELRKWQIEQRDFAKLLVQYDTPDTLYYADSPYVHATRSMHQKYKHELTDKRQIELCHMLNNLKGKYLLSGYDNDLYEEHLKYSTKQQLGSIKTAGRTATETVWANYDLNTNQLFA